uniref:EGF-like domain-containing protein n=1 Tax=Glossina brevipalpis TaxID=37001 RepID=A0A1A9W0H7_9MUSC
MLILPISVFQIASVCLLALIVTSADYSLDIKERKEKATKLPPCKACTALVDSFKLGLEKTSRGKHAGGDAAWEEEKLRSYKTSEVRFVEIQENLCQEKKRGQDQCHTMANDYEPLLEEWFTQKQTEADLQDWLCVQKLQFCCPPGHYGSECKPCNECEGNGKCKGDGTRKGNGQCACDAGYSGTNCNECSKGYYEAFRDSKKLLCSECHNACTKEEGCTGAGPKACSKCNEGWRWLETHGCQDVNECIDVPRVCRPNQFCVNNDGSYTCLECDRSCDGCDGDGPDMCKQCANGYTLKEGKCQDESSEQRDKYVNITRFLTYFGLCVATCVIFQSSTHIAYIVGAAVAIYIAASEYWLTSNPQAANKPQLDTKQLEEMIMKSL